MFYSIGEIAKLLGVSIDTLRIYDRKGIVIPFRGKNGYRCYSRNQMIILNYVMMLRKANMSLETIRKMVNETDVEASVIKLKETEKQVERQLIELKNIKQAIVERRELFEKSYLNHGEIEFRRNLHIIYVKIDDIENFKYTDDFSEKYKKHKFIFSFIADKKIFEDENRSNEENVLSLRYAYTYIVEDTDELNDFDNLYYRMMNKDYAYFIIKCIIPTDYSEFASCYTEVLNMGCSPTGNILIRPTTIRNGDASNIDYYEIFVPIS